MDRRNRIGLSFAPESDSSHNSLQQQENVVLNRSCALAIVTLLAFSASGSQYPMLDMVAQRVIQRYEQATCEQLWQQKGQPKSQQEQNMIQMLQSDPQMRTVFIDEVAAPIANKMFTCG